VNRILDSSDEGDASRNESEDEIAVPSNNGGSSDAESNGSDAPVEDDGDRSLLYDGGEDPAMSTLTWKKHQQELKKVEQPFRNLEFFFFFFILAVFLSLGLRCCCRLGIFSVSFSSFGNRWAP
jgi:hypothetical protein